MQYIAWSGGGWDHLPYWDYLKSAKDRMPAHLFEFAANPQNHDLTHPNSLHDSWLDHWTVKEEPRGTESRNRTVKVELCLLGPRHDRFIHLMYGGVTNHGIGASPDYRPFPLPAEGHGDLLVHEVRVAEEGVFVHELVFSKGFAFLVQFTDFQHRIELLK